MSPLSRLAKRLHVKEKPAWDFYLEVKKGFPQKLPDIPAITSCIVQNQLVKPTPQEVIEILKGRNKPTGTSSSKGPDGPRGSSPLGITPTPKPPLGGGSAQSNKRTQPPAESKSLDNPKTAFGVYKKQKQKNPSRGSGGYDGRFGALKSDRDARNFNKPIPRCPHDIPKTKKCAICDPMGFAKASGMD